MQPSKQAIQAAVEARDAALREDVNDQLSAVAYAVEAAYKTDFPNPVNPSIHLDLTPEIEYVVGGHYRVKLIPELGLFASRAHAEQVYSVLRQLMLATAYSVNTPSSMALAAAARQREEAPSSEPAPAGSTLQTHLLGLIRLIHTDAIGAIELDLSDVTLQGIGHEVGGNSGREVR